MKWVLIIFLFGQPTGLGGSYTTSVDHVEFADAAACNKARVGLVNSFEKFDYAGLAAVCFPTATKE